MRRAFFSTDFTFAKIALNEYLLVGKALRLDRLTESVKLLFKLPFAFKSVVDRMLDFIVSSSNSTFLSGPRSHCKDLRNIRIKSIVYQLSLIWKIYLYASSSRPFNTKKLGVSGIYITVINNIKGAPPISIASCRQSK